MTEIDTDTDTTPAEPGVWIFVLADMCIFAMYFGVFAWDKVTLPEQFARGQATLNQPLALLNTLVLLTSSYFVANAVRAARSGELSRYRRFMKLTMACGALFVAVKASEYAAKFAAGHHIATNAFYRDYFAFTGFHMVHVILGLGFLGWAHAAFPRAQALEDGVPAIEGVALYWHMTDLLWVVLFALIYLVP